ncbi:hypothetical protein [Bacillus sonorensis]|uniref:hypothetical protein n=2 Tax=Bacillus sonorensis TaxID=119858 RepID=UPI000BA7399F|nr:hypothetical protein [Bacillus sonorensis]PAD57566.1 hypothetical protein CHH92_24600 [Bacillus sonorensis]RHJ03560.1 hypothetical protein DW143_24645 [Bacillus sonorensis]WPP35399.1 hypothetical protein SK061_17365 [Bacillus sonorensis]
MSFELNLAHMSISDLLEKAAEKKELIYIQPEQKKIGKTSALIQFARENHCPILMNEIAALDYQRIHPDLNIIGYVDGSELDGLNNVICDEGIPFDAVKRLYRLGHIITGFISKETLYVKADTENKPRKELQFLSIPSDDCDTDSESLDSKNSPLLQIELEDIDSIPHVFYKGERITERIAIDFEWRTGGADKVGSTYIRIKHGNDPDKALAVETKELAVGERAYE